MNSVFDLAAAMMRPRSCSECPRPVSEHIGQNPVCIAHWCIHVFRIALNKCASDYYIEPAPAQRPRKRTALRLPKHSRAAAERKARRMRAIHHKDRNTQRYAVIQGTATPL